MNDQHVLALVETIHGADFHTIHQLTFDAALIDYIGHSVPPKRKEVFVAAYAALTQRAGVCEAELRILTTQPAHGMTGVTSLVLLADLGDQRLRTLHLNPQGSDQRVLRVNDNVSRFPPRLHRRTTPMMET
jgi:hypothetical protein